MGGMASGDKGRQRRLKQARASRRTHRAQILNYKYKTASLVVRALQRKAGGGGLLIKVGNIDMASRAMKRGRQRGTRQKGSKQSGRGCLEHKMAKS